MVNFWELPEGKNWWHTAGIVWLAHMNGRVFVAKSLLHGFMVKDDRLYLAIWGQLHLKHWGKDDKWGVDKK